MQKYVSDMEAQKLQAYNMKVAAAQKAGSTTRRIQQPWASDPFDGQSGNPFRFVAIARVPWLSRESQEVKWGFYCIGCEKPKCRPLH